MRATFVSVIVRAVVGLRDARITPSTDKDLGVPPSSSTLPPRLTFASSGLSRHHGRARRRGAGADARRRGLTAPGWTPRALARFARTRADLLARWLCDRVAARARRFLRRPRATPPRATPPRAPASRSSASARAAAWSWTASSRRASSPAPPSGPSTPTPSPSSPRARPTAGASPGQRRPRGRRLPGERRVRRPRHPLRRRRRRAPLRDRRRRLRRRGGRRRHGDGQGGRTAQGRPPPRKWFNVGGRARGLEPGARSSSPPRSPPSTSRDRARPPPPSPPSKPPPGVPTCRRRVAQEALTVDADGKALTVQEATDFADHTLQWSMWTVLEMLRSPAWVGAEGAGGAGATPRRGTERCPPRRFAPSSRAGRRVARPGAAWPAWATARRRSNSTFARRRGNPRRSAGRPRPRRRTRRFCATTSSRRRSSSRCLCKPGKISPIPRERRRRTRYRVSWDRTCPR